MRYTCNSWNDVDRALEAFKYARRSLLVVMALALPFAAWDAASPGGMTTHDQPPAVQTVKHVPPTAPAPPVPVSMAHPMSACDPAPSVGVIGDVAV